MWQPRLLALGAAAATLGTLAQALAPTGLMASQATALPLLLCGLLLLMLVCSVLTK
jgi:hypothetical protein